MLDRECHAAQDCAVGMLVANDETKGTDITLVVGGLRLDQCV